MRQNQLIILRDARISSDPRRAACSAGRCDELVGFQRTASLASEGAASLRSSTCLALISDIIRVVPVRFAPGRAMLATTPLAKGSPIATKTSGWQRGLRGQGNDDVNVRPDKLGRQLR